MTDLNVREAAVQETLATWAPDGLAERIVDSPVSRTGARARNGAGSRVMNAVLAHLPLGVAVIDADSRLLFWNEQAGCLFGVPPMIAAGLPSLAEILVGIRNLAAGQKDRIIAFCASHIAAGDRAEPESFLRVSLGRDQRLVIQVCGIGYRRWMLVIDDGKMALATERSAAPQGGGDAFLDPLTGLSNRRHFNQVLQDLVETAAPDAHHAVLMIDLDRFKPVNDTLGHPVGDALLCLVARRLRREARDNDMLVRLGGDEFVILVPNTELAEPLAKRVVDILSRPFLVEGHVANISASIGIARFPEHGATADELLRHADLALYDAKSCRQANLADVPASHGVRTLRPGGTWRPIFARRWRWASCR